MYVPIPKSENTVERMVAELSVCEYTPDGTVVGRRSICLVVVPLDKTLDTMRFFELCGASEARQLDGTAPVGGLELGATL